MCQLEQAIKNLLITVHNNSIIPDIDVKDLDYEWKQSRKTWDEEKVNDYFFILRGEILSSLIEKTDMTEILKKIVRSWGGIKSLGNDKYSNYQMIIRKLWENNEFEIEIGPKNDKLIITIDPNCPVCYNCVKKKTNRMNKKRITPLSTWTKVLAAYDPTRFWIYDARVALALRFLSNIENGLEHYNWFIPASRQYLHEMTVLLNADLDVAAPKESYQKYISLLLCQEEDRASANRIIKTASHFEKRLFMLGGKLRDLYKTGTPETQNAIIALARTTAN